MLLDVCQRHTRKLGGHRRDRIGVDLVERRPCKLARKLHIRRRLECLVHAGVQLGEVGNVLRSDLEHRGRIKYDGRRLQDVLGSLG